MFLLIATIFIAELIIALTLISYILKADNYVIELDKQVVSVKPQIKAGLSGVREGVRIFKEKQGLFFEYVEKKRNQYIMKGVTTVLVYLLLFILKGRCKRAAAICNGLLLAKDVWDNISA